MPVNSRIKNTAIFNKHIFFCDILFVKKVITVNQVKLPSYQLPLVNEVNYLEDLKGELIHPNRLLPDLHVFIFVQSGQIDVIEENTHYTLTSGSYLFLHSGLNHWGTTEYQPNTSWYYIHFFANKNTLTEEYYWTESPSIIPEDTYHKSLTLPKTGRVAQPEYFSTRLQQIVDNRRNGALIQSLDCYQLFLELYQQNKKTNRKPQVDKIVSKVQQLCQASQHKLTSDEIAEFLHLNYAYISNVFKKETGITISHYQNQLMIERAIRLFNQTDLNITEVSEQLDFPNPFYFSRVFKQVTGISPSLYLKQRYRQS